MSDYQKIDEYYKEVLRRVQNGDEPPLRREWEEMRDARVETSEELFDFLRNTVGEMDGEG